MEVYSYLIDHDYGLAPNPFGKYCTLAVCKPIIRKSNNLQLGDWIIGTGAKSLQATIGRKLTDKLIYAMKVTERISLEEYWCDNRFLYKKPIMNGSLVTMFGDNFYHKDENGNWIQEDSAHCKPDGLRNLDHLKADIGGKNVLISDYFYYFGDKAIKIPTHLMSIVHTRQGHKKINVELRIEFINWLTKNFTTGIQGDPLNWIEYNQRSLF